MGGLFVCHERTHRHLNRPAHPARGLPPPARRRARELPAGVGRAGPAGPSFVRGLRLAAGLVRGGGKLRAAGGRLPRLRARGAAGADGAGAGRGSRPARQPFRRRRDARPLRPRAGDGRGALRRPGGRRSAARGAAAVGRAGVALAVGVDAPAAVAPRVRARRRESEGAHPRRRRVPDRALAAGRTTNVRKRARALPLVAAGEPLALPVPARAGRPGARRLLAGDARQGRGAARLTESDRGHHAAGRRRRRAAALVGEGPRRACDARRPRPQRPLACLPARPRARGALPRAGALLARDAPGLGGRRRAAARGLALRPAAGLLPGRHGLRGAEGARDAADRGARAPPSRPLRRRRALRAAGRGARRVHRDPNGRTARRGRAAAGRRRDRRRLRSGGRARRVPAQAGGAGDGDRAGGGARMILLIDNYDSFTYNLAHLFGELGAEVVVRRNDTIDPDEAQRLPPSHLVISPGPGRPADAGVSVELVRRLGPSVPTLGVCLGHQVIVEAFGGEVGQAQRLLHGEASGLEHARPDRARRPRALPGPARALRGRPLPLARRDLDPGRPRDLRALRRGRGDGRPPSRAARGRRPVPPRVGADAGRPRARAQLPGGCSMTVQQALARLLDGHDLSRDEARAVMNEIMEGEATPAQIGGFLVALRLRGETADEIAGCAEAMRAHVLQVRPKRDDLVDTAGTGGDAARTINISTAAALVAAAAGAGVAKHGNRAVSSASGSADVLEALGFRLELPTAEIERSIDELGFGFLFAPTHHPAMRHAAPVRRELAARTVFNVLGPLTNPARARAQIVGVYSPELVPTIAGVLASLGAHRAFVVHGAGGIDGLPPAGPNLVCEVAGGDVVRREIDPLELGIERCAESDLRGGSPEENAT